ncbi:MAG: EAL domain-containing protein [Gammaproteobacteria bacterium]|nr:EAL domain-containing protein [Gammaproteobacteria bacterium]
MSSTRTRASRVISLKKALFVCFLLVASVPVLLLTAWFQQQAFEQERERVHENHLLVAKNLTSALDRYALDIKAAATTVAGLFDANADLSRVGPLLERLEFNHLCLLSPDDEVLAVAKGPNGQAARAWPDGFEGLRDISSNELSFLPIRVGSDGQPGIWLTRLYDDGRLLIGVINTDYFKVVQAGVAFGELGHAAIVDQAGSVIAHPKKAWVDEAKSIAKVSPVQAMMRGETGVIQFYSPAVKADMVAGFSAVPSTGWGVMVPQPLSELQAAATRSSSIAIVVGGIGVVGAAILAWLLSGWVTGPISTLVNAAQRLSKGKRPNLDGASRYLPFEFGQLNQAFESMAKRISHTHAELKTQAEKDGLTGLTNRTEIQGMLHAAVNGLSPNGSSKCGLLYVDLDRFKVINDSLGHAFGDEVLLNVAQRLERVAGEAMVARLGGDEFLIVEQGFIDRQVLFAKAQAIVETLQEPFWVGDHSVQIDCAVGIAVAPDDATNAEVCLRRADVAMYHAKRDREERICFYAPFMQEEVDRRQGIEQSLRRALKHGGLELVYQPRVDLETGHATTVEALLRWPSFQALQNATIPEVIQVAEHTGLMNELGRWVLTKAFQDLRDILSSDGTPVTVSVNLSAAQFSSPRLADNLLEIVLENDFTPERLEVEITETTAMADVEQACNVLTDLAKYGVSSSIDDFGTGYSSLSYLKRLPVRYLKIDRSFVQFVDKNADDQAIVRMILSLSETLGIPAIAEGVETKAELEFLAKEGCSQVQGYWFAKPMPVFELSAWMDTRGETLGAGGLRDASFLEETTALALNLENVK